MRIIGSLALVLLVTTIPGAARIQEPAECVVIHDERTGIAWRSNESACAVRLSPASTFKIPHALIALETGAVTPATTEQWDGTSYSSRPSWQRSHQLDSAIRNSVLWFFQRTAVRIGPARMKTFLEQFGYGNADTSGPPDGYWVNGRLRISADEQIAFLRRFYGRRLPIQRAHLETVQRALVQRPGTVQNATGIHALADPWDAATELSAKTGAGMALEDPEVRVSWLVGRLSTNGNRYVFAANVVRRGPLEPIEASRVAFRVFRQRGLVPR